MERPEVRLPPPLLSFAAGRSPSSSQIRIRTPLWATWWRYVIDLTCKWAVWKLIAQIYHYIFFHGGPLPALSTMLPMLLMPQSTTDHRFFETKLQFSIVASCDQALYQWLQVHILQGPGQTGMWTEAIRLQCFVLFLCFLVALHSARTTV